MFSSVVVKKAPPPLNLYNNKIKNSSALTCILHVECVETLIILTFEGILVIPPSPTPASTDLSLGPLSSLFLLSNNQYC